MLKEHGENVIVHFITMLQVLDLYNSIPPKGGPPWIIFLTTIFSNVKSQ